MGTEEQISIVIRFWRLKLPTHRSNPRFCKLALKQQFSSAQDSNTSVRSNRSPFQRLNKRTFTLTTQQPSFNATQGGCKGAEPPAATAMLGGVQTRNLDFTVHGVCEDWLNATRRSYQKEKIEKRYTLLSNERKANQHHLQRPRGTSRVFIDFHRFSLIVIVS